MVSGRVAAAGRHNYYGSAIGWTGSSLILADMSVNGSLDYWWQQHATTPWPKELVAAA